MIFRAAAESGRSLRVYRPSSSFMNSIIQLLFLPGRVPTTIRHESQQIAAWQQRGPTISANNSRSRLSNKTNPPSEGMCLNRCKRGNCCTEYNHTIKSKAFLPMEVRSRQRPAGPRSLPAYQVVGAQANPQPRLRCVRTYIEGVHSHASTTTPDAVTA